MTLISHNSHLLTHNLFLLFLIPSNLNSNQLSGTIPDWIGNLSQLISLYVLLSFPSFISVIISSYILSLISSKPFFSQLYSNQLNGTLPDSIGDLTKLAALYVSSSYHFHTNNSSFHIFIF